MSGPLAPTYFADIRSNAAAPIVAVSWDRMGTEIFAFQKLFDRDPRLAARKGPFRDEDCVEAKELSDWPEPVFVLLLSEAVPVDIWQDRGAWPASDY